VHIWIVALAVDSAEHHLKNEICVIFIKKKSFPSLAVKISPQKNQDPAQFCFMRHNNFKTVVV
jgi:hypothetical protein